ncbi:hypothetical protein BCV70DRAFT_207082 [Testicularia cyperi]|uniref:Uncharacterized protein n=1 Tax=Testicularia cyperi TaxID=1882483 RepID=A0A317XQD1_9BASI|nr:hypothetical protein BCV70DRAFT_207082 [Testicularia cyperi]
MKVDLRMIITWFVCLAIPNLGQTQHLGLDEHNWNYVKPGHDFVINALGLGPGALHVPTYASGHPINFRLHPGYSYRLFESVRGQGFVWFERGHAISKFSATNREGDVGRDLGLTDNDMGFAFWRVERQGERGLRLLTVAVAKSVDQVRAQHLPVEMPEMSMSPPAVLPEAEVALNTVLRFPK